MKTIIAIVFAVSILAILFKFRDDLKIFFKTQSGEIDNPTDIKYRLIKPNNSSANLPLLVLLHGASERGNDNFGPIKTLSLNRIIEISNKYNSYILIPQCPKDTYWIKKKVPGFYNYNSFDIDHKNSRNIETVENLIQKIIKSEQIDTSRIYCMGHSMGGGGTIVLAVRNPNLFAAIAPISCSVDHYNIDQMAKTPCYITLGDDDQFFSIAQVDSLVTKLRERKDAEVVFNILPNKRHNIYREVLNDNAMLDWIFQKQKKLQ
jgi:predicted peptidase